MYPCPLSAVSPALALPATLNILHLGGVTLPGNTANLCAVLSRLFPSWLPASYAGLLKPVTHAPVNASFKLGVP